ncbi:MAG: hypothetical protein CL932_09860 [Deltaproteobacteria bacterium]|nr:hypothetical protein [Deltaproteobacteria bacterium]
MIVSLELFGWYHRVQTRCYREGTLAARLRIDLNAVGLKVPPERTNIPFFTMSTKQKTHYKYVSKRESKDMACYIRLKGGDEIGWSGEFVETQVQRPPDQHSSIPPYISDEWSLLSKGLRGGKSRRRRVESLLRHMIASV